MKWVEKTFARLSNVELYQIIKLRIDVFVVEQNCIYADLDDKDCHSETRHLMLLDTNNQLIGYCRILPQGLSYPHVSIGRVVIAPQARKKGLATQLLQRALVSIQKLWPQQDIQLGAQEYLVDFYQDFGFRTVSKMYLEDGIPHRDMLLSYKNKSDY
ncbi:MAG: GNAT family N-acetyltransferase [Parashewanella sp.]